MTPLEEIFYQAIEAKIGVVVTTDNPDSLKTKLYTVRRQANDPRFFDFRLILSPVDPRTLFVMRKKCDLN